MKLRVALDLDQTIFDFKKAYNDYFDINKNPNIWESKIISKNVFNLRNNRDFWINLPLIEQPDFEPEIYATKRVNKKSFTKRCLEKNNLPVKPIYQTICQSSCKATIIKGRCDVLIDDDIKNVTSCIKMGVPAILIDRNNEHKDFKYRIDKLKIEEIEKVYKLFINK